MRQLNVLEVAVEGEERRSVADNPGGEFPRASTSGSSSGSSSSTSEDKLLQNFINTSDLSRGPRGAAGTSRPKFGLEDFEILRVLGKGAFGKVFQVRAKDGVLLPTTLGEVPGCPEGDEDTTNIFALKAMNKSRILASKTDIRHTKAERDALASVSHPFIVKLHCAFETKDRLYLVQEFCCGGELFRRLEVEQLMLEKDAVFYLTEIVLALDYLHSKDVVYRDLKTENVMLDAKGHVKLVDFGFCKMNMGEGILTKTFCGTVEYMAPEVILNESGGYGKPADWWSLGIFTFDLLTGRSPFYSTQGKAATKDRILRGKFPTPRILTPDANDFIRRLLRRNVAKRLGFAGALEVKSHPLFTGIDWAKVLRREYMPPFLPAMRHAADVQNFDTAFTSQSPRESSSSAAATASAAAAAAAVAAMTMTDDESGSIDLFADFYFESEEFCTSMLRPDHGKAESDDDDENPGFAHGRGEKTKATSKADDNDVEEDDANGGSLQQTVEQLEAEQQQQLGNNNDNVDEEEMMMGLRDLRICSFGYM